MVKIVEVEFNIDANDDTIAAAKAANIRPFKPTGIKFFINQGAALSLATFPALPKNPSLLNKAIFKFPVLGSRFIT